MIFLTFFSSKITSMAIQPGTVKREIVGFLRAGITAMILERFFSSRFIFKPTMPSAAKAPFKRIAIFSILFFFQGFFKDFSLAIKRVLEDISSATILNLFALKLDPVSVNSTIASTRVPAFASVAPQENSTSALILFFFK